MDNIGKGDDIQSPDQIAKRKIIKIKRHNPKTGAVTVEYPKDQYETPLTNKSGKKEENKSIEKPSVPLQLIQVVGETKKIGPSDQNDDKMVQVGLFQQNSSNLKSPQQQSKTKPVDFKPAGLPGKSPQQVEEPFKTNAKGGLIFGALGTGTKNSEQKPDEKKSSLDPTSKTVAQGSLFGGNQEKKPQVSSLFGGGASAPQQQTGSLFGGQKPTAVNDQKPATFGEAGSATAQPVSSIFGGAPPVTTSLFGQKPQGSSFGGNQEQKPQGSSIFGGAPPAPIQQTGSLFGAKPNDTKAAVVSSLFGGATSAPPVKDQGISLFSGNAQSNANSKPKGLFGQNTDSVKPAGGSLFGGQPQGAVGSLFAAPTGDKPKIFGGDAKPQSSLFAPAPAGGGGGLFGQAPSGAFGGGAALFGGGKTFDKPSGSLFGQTNMFTKPEGAKPSAEPEYGEGEVEEGDNYVTADEPPSVVLGEAVSASSPFSKIIETQVEKFKFQLPPKKEQPEADKKSCGNGRISINKAELTPGKFTFKLIFRSNLGKILFDQNIHWQSKVKQIEEKADKHQLKVLTVKYDAASKKQQTYHCKINFQRKADMIEFENKVKLSISESKPKQ